MNARRITVSITALALALLPSALMPSASMAQFSTSVPLGAPGQSPPGFVPGHTVIAGPAQPAFTITGSIVVTTVGSVTTGVLNVVPPTTSSPVLIPIGSVLTGAGITAGTIVNSAPNGTNNYSVITTGGTIAGVAAETITVTPKLTNSVQDSVQGTAVVYAAGGCTTGPPAVVAGSFAYGWQVTNGTSTCGQTITLTMPAAPVAWNCVAVDVTNPTSHFFVQTNAASTTSVVLTDYNAAGAAQNQGASDVIAGSCLPR